VGLPIATLTVDLAKIAENARTVVAALPDVAIIGVTKVTCGSPEIARAMLQGGVRGLGESRLENIARLREACVAAPIWLLRAPTPDLAEDTVRLADVSLESEFATLCALDAAAAAQGKRHGVVVMVDLGDLREGVMPAELPSFLAQASGLAHLDVLGIGTSLTCYGAIVPTPENLGQLVSLAKAAERQLERKLTVSGGMSTSLDAFESGDLPAQIDNLRVGEAIVLGVSPASRERILGLHTDALVFEAPVIECKVKPSRPIGISAQDAFGETPDFEDRGERRRAICAIGRQDVVPGALRPVDPRIEVLGASSDHLILDVHDLAEPPQIGDPIAFIPGYSATLALFTSPYVAKVFGP
jgi:predicted amino acid racemase